MSAKLVIISTGAITAAGLSSEQICAATRAGISAYEESDKLLQTAQWESIIAATIPFRPRPTEGNLFGRLVAMARLALEECLAGTRIDVSHTALFLGLPENYRLNRFENWVTDDLLTVIQEKTAMAFHSASQVLPHGNASVFYGLLKARELLQRGEVHWCVVGGVDSFLNSVDLDRLEHAWRLNREGESQGLVPGEGAAFVVVTTAERAAGDPALGIIAGIGLDEEGADTTVLSDGHPTGKGLERALVAATRDTGIHESEVGLRVSDLNGERYGAFDSMLAVSRFYRTDRDGLPIWHPAESFGETGAAVGALLLMIACDGMLRGYAPAATVMCEVSSEGGLRGAGLLRATEQPSIIPKPSRAPRVERPIIPFIISQHAEEAAFLWLQRDSAVHELHYDLNDLAELDGRLEAHLDGLRIAGDRGWEICKEVFAWEEAGEVFTAAVLAFESGDEARIQTVLETGMTSPELSRGLISALGWLPYSQAERHIRPLLTSESPNLRRIGIGACAVHRHDPGHLLVDALSSDDPLLKVRALRAVGELGRVDLLSMLQSRLIADDDLCRYAATWSAVLLGDFRAIPTLQAIARSEVSYREEAGKIVLRRLDLTAAHDWQQALTQSPDTMRLAIIGAGAIGDPVLIPWLIEQMAMPELARVAGEAFSMITGVDISYEDLEGEWPAGFEAGPTENPEDENVDMDSDEDLPWPNPDLVQRWWGQHRGQFQSGTRYLLGQPMSLEWLQQVLRISRQRQRGAAALELAIRQPGQPLFEVRAPGFRQQQILRSPG